MTISGALSNAMTGLRAAGRSSEVVSANIANALTPGYAVRRLGLSSSQLGGVQIDGIARNVDPGLLSDKRLAEASFRNTSIRTKFLTNLENIIGLPDEPDSLAARMSELENSLVVAAARPDAPERLEGVVNSVRDLIGVIAKASDDIQEARSEADRTLGNQIERLNSALLSVKDINERITRTLSIGGDTSALQDNRQALIDEVSALVPVRQIQRDNGQVALYSTGGAILLDGSAAKIEFNSVNQVTPYMTIGSGSLSGLSINGIPVRSDSQNGALRGGSIAAQFEIRDELGPSAQTQLDALARDLVERFQDPTLDSTLGAGDPGLFTDDGAAFDPVNELGLSSRLSLNAIVDSRRGGEAWRIRDGLNALTPGDVGGSRLIQSLSDRLTEKRVPPSGLFGTGAFSSTNLVATLTSQIGLDRYQAEQSQIFASSQFDELTQLLLAQGVDTDEEMQRLLLIEQSYAANARMIQAADEMIQAILRI